MKLDTDLRTTQPEFLLSVHISYTVIISRLAGAVLVKLLRKGAGQGQASDEWVCVAGVPSVLVGQPCTGPDVASMLLCCAVRVVVVVVVVLVVGPCLLC